MNLSYREKQSLYHNLAQLLRAGVTAPAAAEKLSRTARGNVRRLVTRLRSSMDRGRTVAESFADLGSALSETERTTLTAADRAGRLDSGMQHLSEYFGALERARSEMLRRSAYPMFILHFGVLILNVPKLFQDGAGMPAYLRSTGFVLFFLWGALAIVALLFPLLRDAGASSPALDRLLGWIPLIGKMRRSFALARFCSTYEMQLEAGVNVIDSVLTAGRASRSGRIQKATERAVPGLREGLRLGPLLDESGAFPPSMMESFLVGEETGKLDQSLRELTAEYQAAGFRRLESFSEWAPRLAYVGILLYLAWNIVSGYMSYINGALRQLDSI